MRKLNYLFQVIVDEIQTRLVIDPVPYRIALATGPGMGTERHAVDGLLAGSYVE